MSLRSPLLYAAFFVALLSTTALTWAAKDTQKPAAGAHKPAAAKKPAKKAAAAPAGASKKLAKKTSAKTPPKPIVGPFYATRLEAIALADDIATRRNLDRTWVREAIGQANFLPQVQRLMTPAPTGAAKNWAAYRARFVEPRRIAAGVDFWQANKAALDKAERDFGVPAQVIVGIIGVETLYGAHTGDFRIMDALTTLAFDYPPDHPRLAERSAYFKGELEQFLSQCNRTNVDPLAPRGSYAGAYGLPQFMPSSQVRYAIDFDGDGRIDLLNSPADAIGSVANYFKGYGWEPGLPTHYPVAFDTTRLDKDALMAPDILPTFTVASFTAKGAVLQGPALEHQGPLALIELQNGADAPSYVAGTQNFYAITRYNQSSYYAMAVIELGETVRAALLAETLGR